MGNKLGLLVPGVRSSGNTAKRAQKLGQGNRKRESPWTTDTEGKTKGHSKRNALKIYHILFLTCLPMDQHIIAHNSPQGV